MAIDSKFKVALIQMRSGLEPEANLAAVLAGVDEAKRGGADYVQTPEMTNVLENKRERLFTKIFSEEHDPTLATLREVARKLSIYIHLGSLAVKASPEKAANRSFLIDRKGDVVARYDKIHMFDVDLANGESYRESNNFRPGDLAVLADLPWGRLGLTVCYDLRFPALYRALAEAGASFLAIPAAFTKQTGEAHWHVLQRARAIENGCFVFAAAQGGRHENHVRAVIAEREFSGSHVAYILRLPEGSEIKMILPEPFDEAAAGAETALDLFWSPDDVSMIGPGVLPGPANIRGGKTYVRPGSPNDG